MRVLVDSDALFAAFSALDPNYERAVSTFRLLRLEGVKFLVLKLVLFEVVTVISHRLGQQKAVEFVDKMGSINLEQIDFESKLEKLSWILFCRQTKKGTSFIDCANVVAVKELKLDGILSFDKFYRQAGGKGG